MPCSLPSDCFSFLQAMLSDKGLSHTTFLISELSPQSLALVSVIDAWVQVCVTRTDMHAHTHTDTHTYTQTHTDTHTHRHAHTHTHSHTKCVNSNTAHKIFGKCLATGLPLCLPVAFSGTTAVHVGFVCMCMFACIFKATAHKTPCLET